MKASKPTLVPSREVHPFSLRRKLERSADFQSAVSPNWIRQRFGPVPRVDVPQHPAECNSAIQQNTILRYEGAPNRNEEQSFESKSRPPVPSWESLSVWKAPKGWMAKTILRRRFAARYRLTVALFACAVVSVRPA